jgi:7,8-dihydroneopterin aldolase/epimerase/oxygenase
MIVEVYGLEVFGYHGVYEEERRNGQLFLFDVQLDVGERGAGDVLADAIDYTKVAGRIRELSDARRFDLLEGLGSFVADDLYEQFRPKRLKLRVRKQPAGLGAEHSAVTVQRP